MASKYIQKFPVPEGFPEILHDLAKEILRNQPGDIIDFSAAYFKCLQEGLVLDYKKKGKNIPCDYKAKVPKKTTSEELLAGKRQISRQDEEDHSEAVEHSKVLNHMTDAARVNMEEAAKKMPKEEVQEENVPKEEVKHIVPTTNEAKEEATNKDEKTYKEEDNRELSSLSSYFIEDVMSKKMKDYHGKKKIKHIKSS